MAARGDAPGEPAEGQVHSEPPGSRSGPAATRLETPDESLDSASAEEQLPAVALALSARGSASSRGERALELLARAPAWGLRGLAGLATTTGPQAPPRLLVLAGLERPGEALAAELLVRLLPPQRGAALVAARAEVHGSVAPAALSVAFDAARLTLDGTGPPAGAAPLTLLTAACTAEAQVEATPGLSLALRGFVGLSSLSAQAPARASLWLLPGAQAGLWSQRAGAAVGLLLERPAWGGRINLGLGLPAGQPGTVVESTLGAERRFGALALALELAVAHQPGLWLGRAVVEVRWGS